MKTKLHLSIDETLVPLTKEYARSQGMSVSQLVEKMLREVTGNDEPTFSKKWRGRFKQAQKEDLRFKKLKARFLS